MIPIFQRACMCLPFLLGSPALSGQGRVPACEAPGSVSQVAKTAAGYGSLGNWFVRQHRYPCAVQAFEQGLKLQPGSAPLHYSAGTAFYAEGDREHARGELQRAAELDTTLAQPHLLLGVLAHDGGDRGRALEEWGKTLSLDPHSATALDWLAKTRIEAGEYTAALDLLGSAPPTEDLAIDLLFARSKALLFEKAIAGAGEALQQHAAWQRLRVALATVLVQRNRPQEASVLLQAALAAQPDAYELRVLYLRVMVLTGQNDTALPYAEDLLKTHPRDFDALYLAGLLERGDGDYAAALTHLKDAVASQPKHYDARFNLGATLAKLHRPQEARQELQTAESLPEAEPEVHFQLAGVDRELGDAAGAEAQTRQYKEALSKRASRDELISLSAQAAQKLASGDAAGAASVERTILGKFPDEAVHWYDLALALDRTGDTKGEMDALRQAVGRRPGFALAWNQLGYLQLRAGEGSEAEADFRKAIAASPQYAEAESNLGSFLMEQGHEAEAETYFRSAVQANPLYVEAWINLAASLAERERFPEARRAAESALRVDPANSEAKRLISMLPSAAEGGGQP